MNVARSRVAALALWSVWTLVACSGATPTRNGPVSDAADVAPSDAGSPDADVGVLGDVADASETADTADAADAASSCPAVSPPAAPGTYPGACRLEVHSVAQPQLGRVETFSYDEQDREILHTIDGDMSPQQIPDGQPDKSTTFTYGARGLLSKRRVSIPARNTVFVWDLVYDATDFLREERQTVVQNDGASSGPGSLIAHRADACRRLARTTTYPPFEWHQPEHAQTWTFEYDEAGWLRERRTYAPGELPKDGFAPISTDEFQHDAQGHLTREVRRHDGEPSHTVTIEYDYDGDKLVKKTESSGEPPVLSSYVTYEYDADDNRVGYDQFKADGTHVAAATMTYDCW